MRLLLLISILFFINASKIKAQGFQGLNEDTLFVSFGGYFEYDVVFVYVDGVRIAEELLYSSSSTASSYKGFKVTYLSRDSVEFLAVVYKRNKQFNLEYNPLWWEWDPSKDTTIYKKPESVKIKFKPEVLGRKVEVGYQFDKKWDKIMPTIHVTK